MKMQVAQIISWTFSGERALSGIENYINQQYSWSLFFVRTYCRPFVICILRISYLSHIKVMMTMPKLSKQVLES